MNGINIICEKYLLNMEEKSFFLKKKTEKRQKKAKERLKTPFYA